MHSHNRHEGHSASHAVDKVALRAIFNRNFNIVAVINLLVMTAYYMMFITGTLYARTEYHADLSTAGFTGGIMVLGCLAGRFFTGSLLSLFGCRAILLAGLLLYSGSIAAFFGVHSLPMLFLHRLLMGIGVGVTGTATGTLVAYVAPREYHGLGISLFTISTVAALAAGPFLGIVITGISTYHAVMVTGLSFGVICLAIYFALSKLPPMEKRARPMGNLYSYIDPRVVRFSLVALITCLSYGCVQAFLTSFADERDLSEAAGLFFLVYALAALGTRPISGHILDTRGANIIFYPALLLTSLSMVLLSQSHSGWMLILSGFVLGVGFGNFQSAGQAESLTLVTRSRFAQATTTFFIFFDLGIGIGPYIFGHIIPVAGYDGMFLALAATVLAALALYHIVHGRLLR